MVPESLYALLLLSNSMAPKPISPELVRAIRHEVRAGKSKKQVAREKSLDYSTVKKYTKDINSEHAPKKLSEEKIERIREKVKQGKTKSDVASQEEVSQRTVSKYTADIKRKRTYSKEEKEMVRRMTQEIGSKREVARQTGIPYQAVLRFTQDIGTAKKRKMLGEKSIGILRELLENGYYLFGGKRQNMHMRMLQEYFPAIQSVRSHGKAIAFLPYTKTEAHQAFLDRMDKSIWSHQELKQIDRLFDNELPGEEKQKLVGEND